MMQTHTTKILWENPLTAFFEVTHEWELTELEQANLLGATLEQLNAWRVRPWMKPSGEAMARLDDLLAIQQALNLRFDSDDERNKWLRQPDALPEMGGQSPLVAMCSADNNGLRDVRGRLEARLLGW